MWKQNCHLIFSILHLITKIYIYLYYLFQSFWLTACYYHVLCGFFVFVFNLANLVKTGASWPPGFILSKL